MDAFRFAPQWWQFHPQLKITFLGKVCLSLWKKSFLYANVLFYCCVAEMMLSELIGVESAQFGCRVWMAFIGAWHLLHIDRCRYLIVLYLLLLGFLLDSWEHKRFVRCQWWAFIVVLADADERKFECCWMPRHIEVSDVQWMDCDEWSFVPRFFTVAPW
jgi:hypothetical protein